MLTREGGHVMLSSTLTQLLAMVDMAFVGHLLGLAELGAAALANAYFNAVYVLLAAAAQAVDVAVATSRDGAAPALLLRGIFVALLVALPAMVALSLSGHALLAAYPAAAEQAISAAGYCNSLILGLLPLAVTQAATRWLAAGGRVYPAIGIAIAANILDVGANALLINIGGFLGSPLATSLCRLAQCAAILTHIYWSQAACGAAGGAGGAYTSIASGAGTAVPAAGGGGGGGGGDVEGGEATDAVGVNTSSGGWVKWSGACRRQNRRVNCGGCCCSRNPELRDAAAQAVGDTAALGRMLWQTARYCLLFALEAWPLEATTALAAVLPLPDLAAHSVMLYATTFLFVGVPLGFSVAGRARVQAHLAAGNGDAAHRTTAVACASSVLYMFGCAMLTLATSTVFGTMFIDDAAVATRVIRIAALAAVYQTLDGYQGTLGCVLRGISQRYDLAVGTLSTVAWWGVGLPLAAYLCLYDDRGVVGIWSGMLAAVLTNAACYTLLLKRVDWARRSAAGAAAAATAAALSPATAAPTAPATPVGAAAPASAATAADTIASSGTASNTAAPPSTAAGYLDDDDGGSSDLDAAARMLRGGGTTHLAAAAPAAATR